MDTEGQIPEQECSPVSVRMLMPDDWQVLRDLKLRSLEQEPIAFEDPAEGKEKYEERTEQEWRDMLAGQPSGGRSGESLMVFARDEMSETYIGMVTAIVPAEQTPDHKTATIQHMYVDNAGHRGKGVGKLLLQSLIDKIQARGDIRRVELQVVETQLPAIRLYSGLGFQESGRIPGGAQRGDKSYGEIEMFMELPEWDIGT